MRGSVVVGVPKNNMEKMRDVSQAHLRILFIQDHQAEELTNPANKTAVLSSQERERGVEEQRHLLIRCVRQVPRLTHLQLTSRIESLQTSWSNQRFCSLAKNSLQQISACIGANFIKHLNDFLGSHFVLNQFHFSVFDGFSSTTNTEDTFLQVTYRPSG